MRHTFRAVAAGALLILSVPSGAVDGAGDGVLASQARTRLAALEEAPRFSRPPQDLLLVNLSRYFARYVVPSERGELERMLGTAHRVTAQVAAGFLATLQAGAEQAGVSEISAEFVAGMLAHTLQSATNGYGEVVFFPDRPPSGRLTVEEIDFQAFADTGFAWQALAVVDEERVYEGTAPVPLTADAIDRLHEGVNRYALLLVRLGGLHAKQELAPYLASRHLRAAAKTIVAADAAGLDHPHASPAVGGPFTDVTASSGVRFRHVTSDWLSAFRRYGPIAPTFSGGGVTAGDLDGDGWDDLVLCGGKGCAAFRNRRDGTFEDVTAASGIAHDGEARMAVLADFDSDGDRDLFVTYARDSNRFFANDGTGRFTDVTEASGLSSSGEISGPASAVDVDGDGLLDLYVGNFGDYLSGESPWQGGSATNGMPNRLYRNLGELRFADRTTEAGVSGRGWTQALSHADVDRDGDQDLYVANDFGHNELFLNDGSGRFSEAGERTGSDDRFHGMNVAFADLNRDRRADVFVTNIWVWDLLEKATIETNTLLLSTAEGRYERHEDATFLSHDTGWSWGALFFDLDLDADDDLFVANGFTDYLTFIQNRPHPQNEGETYPTNNGREPNWLFRRDGPLDLTPIPASTALPGVNSRGAALLDFDRDGDLDLAVSTFHSEARLFRNDAAREGRHWLSIDLAGAPNQGVNLDALGAQVVVTGRDDLYVWRSVTGGEGYLSQQAHAAHFGLGAVDEVDVEVLWPDGTVETHSSLAVDRRILIRYGSTEVETRQPLP